jgi:hypothetical protein
MWTFSKRSRQMSLSQAELEETIVERTAEVQSLSQRQFKAYLFSSLHFVIAH